MNWRDRRNRMFMTPEEIERELAENPTRRRNEHSAIQAECWMDQYHLVNSSDDAEAMFMALNDNDDLTRLVFCDFIEERVSTDSSLRLMTAAMRWAAEVEAVPFCLKKPQRRSEFLFVRCVYGSRKLPATIGELARSKIPSALFSTSHDFQRVTVRFPDLWTLFVWLGAGIECLRRCGRNPLGELFRKMRPAHPTLFPKEA